MRCLKLYPERLKNILDISGNVKLVCFSYFLFCLGDGLFCFFLPVHISQLGASSIEVGFLYSINSLVIGISLILGGPLADRFDIKKLLIIGTLLLVPAPIAMALANNWEQLLIPMILYGVSIISIPVSVCIVQSSKGKTLQAFGLLSASGSIAYIVSPLIGGTISAVSGQQTTFFIASILYTLSLLPFFFIRKLPKPVTEKPDISSVSISRSYTTGKLVFLCCFFGSAMFIIFMINPLISQFLASFHNLSIADLGYLGTFAGLGTVFFSLMIGRLGDRYSYLTSISISLLISASAFLVIALFSDFHLFCLGYFLIGASQSFLILISGIIGSKAPQHSIGKWTSVSQAMIYVAGFGAPTLGGILYEISPYLAFYSAIILLLLMASIGVYIIQKFTKT